MKSQIANLLLFSLAFSIVSIAGFAQEIPKKATKIVVTDSTKTFEAHYRSTCKLLLKEGYKLESSDINTEMIITEKKESKCGFMDYAEVALTVEYNTEGKHSVLTITGKLLGSRGFSGLNTQIEYKGAKGSPIKCAWDEMMRISNLISQTSVEYKE